MAPKYDFQRWGPSRKCGDCGACCIALGVKALEKGPYEVCQHLRTQKQHPRLPVVQEGGRGCVIYASRPEECRSFQCAWVAGGYKGSDRPDKTGVVVYMQETRVGPTVTIHEVWPGALNEARPKEIVREIQDSGGIGLLLRTDGNRSFVTRDRAAKAVLEKLFDEIDAMVRGGRAP